MGAMDIPRLHVDVLVQGGVYGPMEATRWRSLVDDPDALGDRLLNRRREAGTPYVFRPLPIQLTAVEILKACTFFAYNRGGFNDYLGKLRDNVMDWLPGWDESPWGWDDDDIAHRLGRPAPPGARPIDPRLTEVAARFAAGGIALQVTEQAHRDLRFAISLTEGAPVVGTGYAFPPGIGGSAPIGVILASDDESAETAWTYAVALATDPIGQTNVWQWGTLIVHTKFLSDQEGARREFMRFLSTWPPPDRVWSNDGEPTQTVHAAEVIRHAALAGNYQPGRIFVARTPSERDRLVELFRDADVRSRLDDLDLSSQSVIVLTGLDDIGAVTYMEVNEAAITDYGPRAVTELAVTCDGPSDPTTPATLILCDHLQSTPNVIRRLTPGTLRYQGKTYRVESP